jgi:hypothetical protein
LALSVKAQETDVRSFGGLALLANEALAEAEAPERQPARQQKKAGNQSPPHLDGARRAGEE